MKTTYYLLPTALLAATFALTAQAETRIGLSLNLGAPPPVVIREGPPRPVIVETQYAAPGPGYVWIAGHNVWMQGRWVWVAGTWAMPPQPGAYYVEGRWDGGSRNWVEAHWEVPPPPPAPVVNQEVVVVAPPPPRIEHRGYAPGPGYVWIDGYWGWHHGRHEWVAGRWDRPPHGHREWVAPRWEHRGGSYVFIEGSWR